MATELWRRLGADSMTPARIAEVVNHELCQNNRDRMFVTLFLGFLDTKIGVLTYVNAGHLGPRLLRGTGVIERVDGKPEMPLAVRAGAVYHDQTVTLLPDDAVFVFSDGVIEAMNFADEFYGVDRLEADLQAAANLAPEEIVQAIKRQVDAFAGEAPKADDVTILALRWLPVQREKHHPSATGSSAAPTPLPRTAHLVIRNDIADLESVSTAMEQIGAEHGVPEMCLIELQVALDEMVSNVIKYAWPDPGSHEIEIRITVEDDGVEIKIIDDGRMFNPLTAPEPEKPLIGQRPRPGGAGVHMTKQLVDAIDYARSGDRNHTTLTKRCALGARSR
jgi:anti-sigma regulatory factor (Ser/Thr protein kinase)